MCQKDELYTKMQKAFSNRKRIANDRRANALLRRQGQGAAFQDSDTDQDKRGGEVDEPPLFEQDAYADWEERAEQRKKKKRDREKAKKARRD